MSNFECSRQSLCDENCPIINVAKSELRALFLQQVAAKLDAVEGLTEKERGLLIQIEHLKAGCDDKSPGYARIETVNGHAELGACRSGVLPVGKWLEAVSAERSERS